MTRFWLLLCLILPTTAFSYEFPPDRTIREADKELGWMVAPLPGCVEGIG